MSEIQSEIGIIASLYSEKKNLIVFDIGAHTFDDGITYKRTFPEIEVYAFEPDKRNIEWYLPRAESFGVYAVPIALSDTDSETMFYPCENFQGQTWSASGGIFPLKVENPDMTWGQPYSVQSVRFDTFCDMNNINHVDYVHMDVQGGEYKVMNSIGKYRPNFVFAETCEFDHFDTGVTYTKFNELMESLGYEIHTKFENDTLYKYKN